MKRPWILKTLVLFRRHGVGWRRRGRVFQHFIFAVGPVDIIQIAENIRANLFMEEQPPSVFEYEICPIPFPEVSTTLFLIAVEGGINQAGGQKVGSCSLSVICDFNNIGDQRVTDTSLRGRGSIPPTCG